MFGKNFGVIEVNDNDIFQINNLKRFFKKNKFFMKNYIIKKIKKKRITIGIIGLDM